MADGRRRSQFVGGEEQKADVGRDGPKRLHMKAPNFSQVSENSDTPSFIEKYKRLMSDAGFSEHSDDEEDQVDVRRMRTAQYQNVMGTTGVERLDSLRLNTYKFVAGPHFNAFMACIILMNTVCMGIEVSFVLNGDDTKLIRMLELCFITASVIELALRFFALGRNCIDRWTLFDAMVVFFSVVGTILPELGFVSIFRVARWMRFARAARVVLVVRELWMLIEGLIVSGNMMMYTLLLLLILLYAFALAGVEFITIPHREMENPDPRVDQIIAEYFSSLPVTMLTLVQFVAMDSCAAFYRPLIKDNWWLAIYFVSIILVTFIAMMNIVTAVLVNSAIEHAEQNRDLARFKKVKEKKRLMKSLAEVFRRLDKDDSGAIELMEVLQAEDEDRRVLLEFMQDVDFVEIFHELDVDNSGCLSIDEFCDGLYQAFLTNTPVELKRVEKNLEGIRRQVEMVAESEHDVLQGVRDCLRECELIKLQVLASLREDCVSDQRVSLREDSNAYQKALQAEIVANDVSLDMAGAWSTTGSLQQKAKDDRMIDEVSRQWYTEVASEIPHDKGSNPKNRRAREAAVREKTVEILQKNDRIPQPRRAKQDFPIFVESPCSTSEMEKMEHVQAYL